MPASSLRTLACVAALPFAFACSAETATEGDVASSEDELRTTYADLSQALAPADYERWLAVKSAIVAGFGDICGDTICSGDYSNLTTVRLGCSATTKTRKLRDCAWTLGGSIEYVNPVTGAISTDARIFQCKVPVASSAKAMLDTLSAAGESAVRAPLPGTGKSFYDALTDCFSGVVGQPPPANPEGPFVDLQDRLWESNEAAALSWLATTRTLNAGFHDVSRDTFSKGDDSAIEGLRLVCAVDASKNKVRSCSWSFARVDSSLDASGRIVTRSTTKTCSVALHVNPTTLTQALANEDPLRTRLPGKTTSLYDALIGCL